MTRVYLPTPTSPLPTPIIIIFPCCSPPPRLRIKPRQIHPRRPLLNNPPPNHKHHRPQQNSNQNHQPYRQAHLSHKNSENRYQSSVDRLSTVPKIPRPHSRESSPMPIKRPCEQAQQPPSGTFLSVLALLPTLCILQLTVGLLGTIHSIHANKTNPIAVTTNIHTLGGASSSS